MWYQIMSTIANVGLAWQDQYLSNRIKKKLYRTAAKTADINAQLTDANYNRRSSYRNEELGQQVWNIAEQAQELAGTQRAAMAYSGFDVSTGDQRILSDTLRRNLERQEGLNRTYYLQQFEDDLQTRSDILQYNFEAYANRQMAKNYSGIRGFAKIVDAGGRAFVNSASPSMFSNPKGGISSNTGAKGPYSQMSWNNSVSGQLQPYLDKSTDISGSLGNYGNFAMKF